VRAPQTAAISKEPAACQTCGIRHLALFADLRETDFEHIRAQVEELRFDAGRQIYGADDAGGFIARPVAATKGGFPEVVRI
jgi:hypothetical protein